jgi:hypothetical protein
MPVYCYRTNEGQVIERVFAMGKAPVFIDLGDGTTAERDIMAEHPPKGRHSGPWPLHCLACGVAPWQAKEMSKKAAEAGVPTEFDSQGDAVFTSRGHRARYMKTFGFFDRDAGYGDYSGDH